MHSKRNFDFATLERRGEYFDGFLISGPLLDPKLTTNHDTFTSHDFEAKKCPRLKLHD